jgi:hypothetical protein
MQVHFIQVIDYTPRPHRLHLRLVESGPMRRIQSSAVFNPVRRKDYIVIFMDSPRSGARHRALAVVDSVCIDHNRAYATPDKDKFSSTKSPLLFTFVAPDTQGLRLKDVHLLTLRSFDEGLWQSTTSN